MTGSGSQVPGSACQNVHRLGCGPDAIGSRSASDPANSTMRRPGLRRCRLHHSGGDACAWRARLAVMGGHPMGGAGHLRRLHAPAPHRQLRTPRGAPGMAHSLAWLAERARACSPRELMLAWLSTCRDGVDFTRRVAKRFTRACSIGNDPDRRWVRCRASGPCALPPSHEREEGGSAGSR